MSVEKLNIQEKADNPNKKALLARLGVPQDESLSAQETNKLVGKTNELVEKTNELNQKFDAYKPVTAFNFKGNKATYAELASIVNPQKDDAYGVIADGLVYIYNGTAFPTSGNGLNLGLKPVGEVKAGDALAVSGGEVFGNFDNLENSKNIFLENGNFKNLIFNSVNYSNLIGIEQGYRISNSANTVIAEGLIISQKSYFSINEGVIVSGTPQIAFRIGNGNLSYQNIVIGKIYEVPVNTDRIYINAGNNGVIDIKNVYLGLTKFNKLPIFNAKEDLINYNKLDLFANKTNVIVNHDLTRKIRIQGNNSVQSIDFIFDKLNNNDYANLLFKSSVSVITIKTEGINSGDSSVTAVTTNVISSINTNHVVNRIFNSNEERVRITVSFTGTESDYLEIFSPAITKSVRKVMSTIINSSELLVTDLKNNKPENLAKSNGVINTYNIVKTANVETNSNYVKFLNAGVTTLIDLNIEIFDRYLCFTDLKNIIGSPKVGFQVDATIIYKDINAFRNYKLPVGCRGIVINAGYSNSIEIASIYIGKNPYNKDWLEPFKVIKLDNYYSNINLNGFANRVTDVYGSSKLRIQGNNSVQTLSITFDKLTENDWASFKYKSSVNQINVLTRYLNASGGSAEGFSAVYVNSVDSTHIITRQFKNIYPKLVLEVSFTGTESDYLEIFSPAITKIERNVTDELINIVSSTNSGGLAKFNTLTDALSADSSGVIQVGFNLLSKKKTLPTSKLDFELINQNKNFSKSAVLTNIKYLDSGDFRLMLITTKKRFIFCDGVNLKYTDDINSCLIPITYVGESRFSLDSSKLIQMTPVNARGVRETGNGELVVITFNQQHLYSTNNQTEFHLSNSHTATVGSIIDGWAVDAYADTVVFSTYAVSPARANGSVILSTDYGKTYEEVFNVLNDASTYLPGIPLESIHIHGVFIDNYRDSIVVMFGDYDFTSQVKGKLLILENYKENRVWKMFDANFKEGPREQYCAGIALEKNLLFGTDMQETCVARMNIDDRGYDSPREWADRLHIGLDYIPNFTRPLEPNAPIGIHYSFIGGSNPSVPSSQIVLTKDGFNFANIYTDTVPHVAFANNNAKVWCSNDGDVYCVQFNGRFTNEVIIGKYNF